MLCLTRRIGERIVIDKMIKVKVLDVIGRQVLLGIDAPEDIPVNREEVQLRIDAEGSTRELVKWSKTMQLYDMLAHRYHFDLQNGDLHYISDDKQHEGYITLHDEEKLSMFINLTRILETIQQGEQ